MPKHTYNVKSARVQKCANINLLYTEIEDLKVENEKLRCEVAYWR